MRSFASSMRNSSSDEESFLIDEASFLIDDEDPSDDDPPSMRGKPSVLPRKESRKTMGMKRNKAESSNG